MNKGNRNYRKIYVALVILAVLGVAGYFTLYPRLEAAPTQTDKTNFLMDTVVTIRAIGRDSEQAVDAAFREMERVESVFSRYIEGSEVNRINENSGQWVEISQEVYDVIQLAKDYGRETKGAFDITIGPLVSTWGFGQNYKRVPSQEEIDQVLQRVDYTQVELDPEGPRVRVPENFLLDLGGIAKGHAVDQGSQVLRDHQIKHGMINAGGDIVTIGTKPDGSDWRVGIQHPTESAEILGVLPLTNQAVVTSGDYERYFEEDGVRFHHIIDPATGYPARGLTSVTVVTDNAMAADILSTAFFVIGLDSSLELIEELTDVDAVFVDSEGEVVVSSGLRRVFQLR